MDRYKARYETWKKVLYVNKTKRLGLNDIMSVYLSQINKATTSQEFDDVLDAIIKNESQLKLQGKGNI